MTVAGGAEVETPGSRPSPGLGLPVPPYAAWSRRVIASVLDGLLGSGIAFLALGAPALTLPFLGVAFGYNGSEHAGVTAWTSSGWAVGAVLVAVLMQAYLGATPGKLVMGLAVVRRADARPIGLVRTLVRYVLHLLDAILFIGFLLPLWTTERLTIADRLASTVVLHTRRPRPYRWPAGPDSLSDPGPPVSWELPAVPRWVPVATTLSATACAGLALFSGALGSSQMFAGPVDLACEMASGDPGSLGLTGGTLSASLYPATETRLGVTRHATVDPAPRVEWELSGSTDASSDVVVRIAFTSQGTADARSYDFPTYGGVSGPWTESRALPVDALAGLGTSWSWSQSVVVDGVESPACTGSVSTG
ncbi:hypothetical protein DDP54_06000 [Cellulomonas sp. WB94]|uniref:RDD family protein n=1 Tax=Cellulomonas sp. WB94 TaxID=2173174 RepID=UPI000D56806C|nr:RDD family protein [Cellulomonas sp. WB94]PVU82627.1 hypothetical protein DDP54_06000 [Cellulomonas sp. WB94]